MKLYAIFHLNLMFSSISEEDRITVIKNCYWPLLKLIDNHKFPLGIEASAITLEIIQEIAPEWITKFQKLLHEGKCELIGSGYSQLIGPLVPAAVNKANLRIGNNTYQKILATVPQIALVNEQAWSAGLVSHYLEAGYKGVFMDYDNPARFAQDWDDHIQHFPQRALGISGEHIPVLWSRSMVFQKLQRLAHDEIEISEYIDYIERTGINNGWLPIYGNDAEIFDFRPGRYKAEASQKGESEWDQILKAFNSLLNRKHSFHLPSEVLSGLEHPNAGRKLNLGSAEQPVPVKKQSKYNLTRWAVSGRNDFFMNSLCRAVAIKLEEMDQTKAETEEKWRELCFCWSSDFRTHITLDRFNNAMQKLANLAEDIGAKTRVPEFEVTGNIPSTKGRLLKIKTPSVSVELNTAKGLAIHKAGFSGHENIASFGTIEHGFFHEIDLGADFFSGHIILEGTGSPKETDLSKVQPHVSEDKSYTQVSGTIEISQGYINKAIRVHKLKQQIDVLYHFNLHSPPQGLIRLGHVTLLTNRMAPDGLFYSVANGGEREYFPLTEKSFDHSNNVSFLVSSSQATGMTDSTLILGGKERALAITPIMQEHAFIAMVTCRQAKPSTFVRVSFSMQEMDETCMHAVCVEKQFTFSTGFSIKPYLKTGSV